MEHGDPFQDGQRIGRGADDGSLQRFVETSPSLRPEGRFDLRRFAAFARGFSLARVQSGRSRPEIADLRSLIPAS